MKLKCYLVTSKKTKRRGYAWAVDADHAKNIMALSWSAFPGHRPSDFKAKKI